MKLPKTLIALALASLLAAPTVAFAQADTIGVAKFGGFGGTYGGTLTSAILTIVNALLAFAAIIAVVFVVIGGVRYITSQGDEDAAVLAKNTVIYALIGVVVIILSAVIVNLIVGAIEVP